MKPKNNLYPISLTWLAVIFIADQLSKFILLDMVDITNSGPIKVTDFFNLVMVWNTGITFGMLQNIESGPLILSVIAIIIVILLLIWLRFLNTVMAGTSIGLICGGALGNVCDRFRFGAVADFFDFHVSGWHWPAFNIADASIFVGALLLCIDSLRSGSYASKPRKRQES